MLKTSAYVVTGAITGAAGGLAEVEWGSLPAWGIVGVGFAFMLKYLIGELSNKLDSIIEDQKKIIRQQEREDVIRELNRK